MATTKESPVILSLCTGLLRGLEVGIEHALQRSVTVTAYAEIEAFIVENLLQGMEKGVLDAAPVWTDLKTFPFAEFRGKVHGIVGGYPCTPFSVAGKQKGTEDPRHLWPYIKEGIKATQPIFCFFENVRGHLNLGYEEVRGDLQSLGYEVREGIYSAQEVGAPHRRDRLFILAIRKDQLVNTDSTPTTYEVSAGRTESGISSEKLAYTIGERHGGRGNFDLSDTQRPSRENFGQYGNNVWSQTEGCGEIVANSNGVGLRAEGYGARKTEQLSKNNAWPARPGEQQYEWESSRIIKPGLGITVNGYNFREDLLRAAGNGVVEQTAELAFKDLLSKF